MKFKNLIVMGIMLLFIIPIKIKATENQTLNYYYNNDLWYTMRGGDKPYSSLQYARYDINGQVVFCIQPGIEITTSNYIGKEGLNESPYSDEINTKLELIGYYGYDYPNHQTLEYRMATQALIWETISGQIVEFWTGPSGTGNHINVETEKNEILNLINAHKDKPSFDKNTFQVNVNEEIEIIDLNNILVQYEISKTDEFEYRIENNKLYIKPLIVGNIEITLEKKKYDDLKTIIYKGEDNISQKVGLFRISDPVISSFFINSYGKIEITKIGERPSFKDNELIYEDVPLEGVEFTLYANEDIEDFEGNIVFEKNNLVSNGITDKNGIILFNNLYLGKYKLVETKTLQNYNIDEKEYIIEIQEKDKVEAKTIKNELKKTIVEVPSTGHNDYHVTEISGMILMILGIMIVYVRKIKVK